MVDEVKRKLPESSYYNQEQEQNEVLFHNQAKKQPLKMGFLHTILRSVI